MFGMVDGYDFFEMEVMKYYAPPASWSQDKKKTNIQSKIFSDEWGAAEKKDGFFAKIIKDEDDNCIITPRNRNTKGEFVNKVEWLPQLVDFFDSIPRGTCLLGELYLPSTPGSKNTQTILGCLKEKAIARQEKGEKIHLYVFDCLAWDGTLYVNRPWSERVDALEGGRDRIVAPYVEAAHFFYGKDLWDELGRILAAGGEGIVIMHKNGVYEPGKRPSKTTLKIKKEIQQTIDCFFTGRGTAPTQIYSGKEIESWPYWMNTATSEKIGGEHYKEYHEGAPLIPVTKPYFNGWAGSLEIGVLKDGKVTPIGFLSGVTDEIKANFKSYAMRPIEVTCMEITEDASGAPGLRHAKMLGFRDDLTPEDCQWSKIFG